MFVIVLSRLKKSSNKVKLKLVNIKISDINRSNRTILILGKGNKERNVEYGEYCEDILNLYLKDGRIVLNTKRLDYLFLNHLGEKLT